MTTQVNIAELIKEKVDIVETIGRIVPLKKSGRNWSGLCPFHTEKDGSFYIYEDSSNFICFGCGAKGDVISFYMLYYHLGFVEACKRLCNENGIDWEPGESRPVDKTIDVLYEVNRMAGLEYYSAMKVEGNPALSYMLGRGIDRRTISKFRLGYANDSARSLSSKLEGNEKLTKAAEEVGLIYNQSGRLRDRYESRVMFPIVSTKGKVIGFGGRDITGRVKAKYINSAGSRVFSKGNNLFGLNITGPAIREKELALLVEGYMDLVSLYMYGVTNVVAQLGTAFTKEQAKLLGRYAKNIVLSLDSDDSGLKAAEKSMDILAAEGLKVRVLVLEGAKDPDEYIRMFGKDAFEVAIAEAIPMVDFKLNRLKSNYDLAVSDELVEFLKEASRVIAPLSPVEQDLYTRRLAKDTGISEDAIRLQTGASGDLGYKPVRRTEQQEQTSMARKSLLKDALAFSLTSSEMLNRAVEYRHFFDNTDYGPVFSAIISIYESTGDLPEKDALFDLIDETDQPILEDALLAAKPKMGSGAVSEYLARFEIEELKDRERVIKDSDAFTEGDMDTTSEYLAIRNRIIKLEEVIRKGEIHW